MKKSNYENTRFVFAGINKYIALFSNPRFFARYNLYKNILYFSGKMGGKLLDFGCGSKPYSELFVNCKLYIGCDVKVSGHQHEEEKIDVYYDGKHLPFDDCEFDSIFSSQVFEHVEYLEEVLPELHRVLKDSGYVLLTVPFVWNEHEIPYDYRRYTSYGIDRLLKENGFKVLDHKKSGDYVQTLYQMRIEYLMNEIYARIKYNVLRSFFVGILVIPLNIIGLIISKCLPSNYTLFLDNVILCTKEQEYKK